MITERAAAITLLVILGALAVFHIFMLAGALPAGIAWGGQAESTPQTLRTLEAVGLVVTALFAGVVAARAGFISSVRVRRPARIGMWVMFGYFVLNVIGNVASTSGVERAIFTPVSLVVALLALRLASGRS
jgi:hypothetical protein